MLATQRAGVYYRVFKPEWTNPLDTGWSRYGGRWNAPETFGALYLSATFEVAAANARRRHAGRAIGLFDLRPAQRPSLLHVRVPKSGVLDVVSDKGVRGLRLPATYPFGVNHARCQAIGKRAYAQADLLGIACRSAAECISTQWLGEELAWFDRSVALREVGRQRFKHWYPDVFPR